MKKWKNALLILMLILFFLIMLILFSNSKDYFLRQPYNASGSVLQKTGEKPPGGKLNAP